MKMICPICHVEGSAQIRGNSVRVGHYKGYRGETRIVEWHATTMEALNVVNNHGKQNLDKEDLSLISHAEVGKRYSARLIIWRTSMGHISARVSRGRGLESRPRHQELSIL